MKSLLAVCGALVMLFAAPLFADTIDLTNQGISVASGTITGGLSAVISPVTVGSLNGSPLTVDPINDLILFDTGSSFTGSLLTGGAFTGGDFVVSVGALPLASGLATNFTGTWTLLPDGEYKLFGTFSDISNSGNQVTGFTTQLFQITFQNDTTSFTDLSGNTTIVPEPGTLTLLGTGLLSLGGMVRRRYQLRAQ
jgi:PEP-CTERM motif